MILRVGRSARTDRRHSGATTAERIDAPPLPARRRIAPMDSPSRLPAARPKDELPRELLELGRAIAELPEESYRQLEQPFARAVEGVRRRRRILNLVQEALSQLRLDVKYLMFDLEATREERDEPRAAIDLLGEDEL